jgi:hypothetical protein
MKAKKEIRFCLETIEDLLYNDMANDYIIELARFVDAGYTLVFKRLEDDYTFTTIKTLEHLGHFKRSFNIADKK